MGQVFPPFRARPKGARARMRRGSPRPVRQSFEPFLHRLKSTKKGLRFVMRIPRRMWERSRAPKNLARGSIQKRYVAVSTGLKKVILLGDGAVWIRGIGEDHFPEGVQIVDLYHALEHLSGLGKMFYGPTGSIVSRWIEPQSVELKEGDIEKVIASMRRLRPKKKSIQEEIEKTLGYFETNKERMRYAEFRKQGLFVGSGVIEAGCKMIVGQRLKQSGMRWTVRGANAIIALRCCQISGRWEEFWENRAAE